MRIGYAFAGTGLNRLTTFSQRYLGYNRLSESIALAALEHPTYYLNSARRIEEGKIMYYDNLSMMSGLVCYRSDANFVLVRFDRPLRALLEACLRDQEIVVKFLNDPGLDDCMRITIGRTEHNVRVLDALRVAVDRSSLVATSVSSTEP